MTANADWVARSADAVLQVDYEDVDLPSRVAQVAVGLCRAAFAQSKAIATLAQAGLLSAAAPNRRLVLEIVIRLHWLMSLPTEDRRKAVDTMLEKDRQDVNRLLAYLREIGHQADFDSTEMDAFELSAEPRGYIHQQATKLRSAVDASTVKPWSVYSMWLSETQYSHASANLAGRYAPTFDDSHLSRGTPDPTDPNLEAHRLLQAYIVSLVEHLLSDEGLPRESAGRMGVAFLEVGAPAG